MTVPLPTPMPVESVVVHGDPWGTVCSPDGDALAVVERVRVAVSVEGLAVRSTWTVAFRNTTDRQLEAFYLFPLPAGAAVVAAAARFGDRHVVAELTERGVARDLFDAAVDAGKRVALIEADRAEAFTLTLGRLVPGEHPAVTLTLVSTLDVDAAIGTVRVPLLVAPRYTGPTAVAADGWRIHAPRTTDQTDVPQAAVEVTWHGLEAPPTCETGGADVTAIPGAPPGCGWRVCWEGVADRDVVVRAPAQTEAVRAVAFARPGGGFVMRLDVLGRGRVSSQPHRDVVVLIDRSGSMAGWKMTAAQRLGVRLVDALGANDRVLIAGFDSSVELSPGGLQAANAPHRRALGAFVETLHARGGTELADALLAACAELHRQDEGGGAERRKVLVLVTDAQVTDEAESVASLSRSLGDAEVYVIGVDQAVNAGLCRDLASAGGGRFDLVTAPERVETVLERAVARVGRPVVFALAVHFAGGAPPAAEGPPVPRERVPVFADAVSTLWLRTATDPTGATVLATGAREGENWREQATVVAAAEPATQLALWARAEIGELGRQHDGADPTAAALATSLALAAGVLCRFTAFVAVDHHGERLAGPVDRVMQPLAYPAGMPIAPLPSVARAESMVFAKMPSVARDASRRTRTAAATVSAMDAAPIRVGRGLATRIRRILTTMATDRALARRDLTELLDDLTTIAAPPELVNLLHDLGAMLARGAEPGATLGALARRIEDALDGA